MAAHVYLSLGSNLGDRDAHLAFALASLDEEPGIELLECSAIYETDAIGPGEQRPYLNAVAHLATTLAPGALLERMLDIEVRAGRRRGADQQVRWLPRTLDLDLLLYDTLCIDEPGLIVPHPRLAERGFVLVPLFDLAPELVHPSLAESIAGLLAKLPAGHDGSLAAGVWRWERCRRLVG